MSALHEFTAPALTVIEGGRRGRPLAGSVADLTRTIDELRIECAVMDAERVSFATDVLSAARRAMLTLAAGYAPRTLLASLERRAVREMDRIAGDVA